MWSSTSGPDWCDERSEAKAGLLRWRQENKQDLNRPIVDGICGNQPVFSGIGRHTAMDICHLSGIHPAMPVHLVCLCNKHFDRFLAGIIQGMDLWSSDSFLHFCATNSTRADYPFTYQYSVQRNYVSSYVKVHEKPTCRVERDLYNMMVTEGLMDPNHIIGQCKVDL
jgi:hypothetical protein